MLHKLLHKVLDWSLDIDDVLPGFVCENVQTKRSHRSYCGSEAEESKAKATLLNGIY